MIHTMEVEIDDAGVIHPRETNMSLPKGRAVLSWESEPDIECALLSEKALAVDWLTPEEDEAWAYMQPEK